MHFNKELINSFANTHEFCNKDINKFIMLLRKVVYPYEYIDSWERFHEISIPNKEDNTAIDYKHANKFTMNFE